MRTNIDIDDALMSLAMKAGPYRTKKDAVEAGLKLLARQVTYREILKWRGKLKWEGDESIDWTKPEGAEPAEPDSILALRVSEALPAELIQEARTGRRAAQSAKPTPSSKRRAGR